jgi:hypothetical protein
MEPAFFQDFTQHRFVIFFAKDQYTLLKIPEKQKIHLTWNFISFLSNYTQYIPFTFSTDLYESLIALMGKKKESCTAEFAFFSCIQARVVKI